MKTRKSCFSAETILAFRYKNQQLECLGEGRIGDYTDELFPPCDENGNEIEGEYTDDSGNGVGLTTADVRSGIGTIDIDGVYDTIYTVRLGSISYTDKEAWAAVKHSDSFTAENVVLFFLDEESREHIADMICGELGVNVEDYIE